MNIDTLETLVETLDTDDFDAVGFRYQDAPASVGDVLPCSYVWDGDEWTDEELPGTCSFYAARDLVNYLRYTKNGYVLVIAGADKGYGDLPGEQIIGNATVLAVVEL